MSGQLSTTLRMHNKITHRPVSSVNDLVLLLAMVPQTLLWVHTLKVNEECGPVQISCIQNGGSYHSPPETLGEMREKKASKGCV